MAFVFETKKTATITAKLSDEQKTITLDGCNAKEESVDNAAAQINKILAIVGRSVNADKNVVKTLKEGAVEQ